MLFLVHGGGGGGKGVGLDNGDAETELGRVLYVLDDSDEGVA